MASRGGWNYHPGDLWLERGFKKKKDSEKKVRMVTGPSSGPQCGSVGTDSGR